MPTIPSSVIDSAIGKLLREIFELYEQLTDGSPNAPDAEKLDDSMRIYIREGIEEFLYGEHGIIATFSKDGTLGEIAERHVHLILCQRNNSNSKTLKLLLPPYALSCSEYIQDHTPGLGEEMDKILQHRRGR